MYSSVREFARPVDAKIVWHCRSVSVLADDDEALFGAQDHQRLEPHEPTVERRQLLCETRAQRRCAARRNGKLVRAVAGEAHPRNPERAAVEYARREGHMRQALVVERNTEFASLDEIARARAGDGQRRPLRGRVVNGDMGRIEAILSPKFKARAHRVRVPRRAGDEETIFAEAQRDSVVEHDA